MPTFTDTKDINQSLKQLRDMICSLSPGKTHDTLQVRFELVLDRIEQMPARIMFQSPFADVAELEMVRHTELLWALSAWEEDA